MASTETTASTAPTEWTAWTVSPGSRARPAGTRAATGCASRWLLDRTGNNEAVATDGVNCNDFDAPTNTTTNLNGGYCCLEWMKY